MIFITAEAFLIPLPVPPFSCRFQKLAVSPMRIDVPGMGYPLTTWYCAPKRLSTARYVTHPFAMSFFRIASRTRTSDRYAALAILRNRRLIYLAVTDPDRPSPAYARVALSVCT